MVECLWYERLWQEMRRLEVFSLPELEVCGVPYSLFATYVSALDAAGYIAELSGKRRNPRYRLINNTGNLAPELQLDCAIFDSRLKKYAWVDLAIYDRNLDHFFPVVRG